jgi:phosphohistidine phosphatase
MTRTASPPLASSRVHGYETRVRLYIMRHGPAEDRADSGRDFDRVLTPSGRDRVRDVARALLDGDEAPYAIFSSPLVRALQTAEIVASVTKLGDRGGAVEVRRGLQPGGDARGLVRACLVGEGKRVMLVGHEPDLSDLAQLLSGRRFPAGLQKAMVVGVAMGKGDPAANPVRLRFVLDPKSLEWQDDAR